MNLCPAGVPASGSPCAPDEQECSYLSPADVCCPVEYIATCAGGAWNVATAGLCPAPPPSCPSAPPAAGAACDPCVQTAPCFYSCTKAMSAAASVCLPQTSAHQGAWGTQAGSCDPSFACGQGGLRCQPGQVCFLTDTGQADCKTDPCAPQPLSCACAGSGCVANTIACDTQGASTVRCHFGT